MRIPVPARLSVLLTLAACGGTPAATAPPPPDPAIIRTAIEAQLKKAEDAFVAKDTVALASVFTDDGVWVLPDASTFKGKAEIMHGAAGFLSTVESTKIEKSSLDHLIVVNDHEAVAFSSWTITMKEKGKKEERVYNPFVQYYQQGSDGAWRVAHEVNALGPAKQ